MQGHLPTSTGCSIRVIHKVVRHQEFGRKHRLHDCFFIDSFRNSPLFPIVIIRFVK